MTPRHKPTKRQIYNVNRAVKRAFRELDRLASVCAKNRSPIRRVSLRNYPNKRTGASKTKSVSYASVVHDS